MAHSSFNFDNGSRNLSADRQQLAVEKLGVIAGFLVGLMVGVGGVAEPLASANVPGWISVPVSLATVALFTWVGHRAGTAAADHLRK